MQSQASSVIAQNLPRVLKMRSIRIDNTRVRKCPLLQNIMQPTCGAIHRGAIRWSLGNLATTLVSGMPDEQNAG
jgi:hypothetical protein